MSRHRLDRRVPKGRLLDVVRDVCGIHAQVQSMAELQVWARVEGVSPNDVRDALWAERSLVRTWCMRGTLHLLTAEDLPLFVAALRQHDRWWKGAWLRMIGFSESELRAILDVIRDVLGARPLSRLFRSLDGPRSGPWHRAGWPRTRRPDGRPASGGSSKDRGGSGTSAHGAILGPRA
ncbi:MAG: DNA glycosylase AlkZ-like family protein, partial [Actinomycetota bacterium]